MSTTYKTLVGDTFATVSRKNYGTEKHEALLRSANPGKSSEPFVAGLSLVIPDLPNAPINVLQNVDASEENEVAILIDGKRFRFWDTVAVTRSLDSVDVVELKAPFEVGLPGFRETFVPFAFDPMEITVGGLPLFKGTTLAPTPTVVPKSRTISLTAYSLPGVLYDCTPSIEAFPLEFHGLGLKDIATTLATPFGISVVFEAEEGAPFGTSFFSTIAIKPNEKIIPYLIGLANQRGLVISSTSKGDLLFWKAIETDTPVAILSEGLSPLVSVVPMFSPQDYYSSITGVASMLIGLRGDPVTRQNPRLEGVVRPFTFEVADLFGAELIEAVEAKRSRMFGNMVSYTIIVNTWRDGNGDLWAPNKIIRMHAPDAMVYDPYDFLIRSATLNRSAKGETATLNLVMPGSFSNGIPGALPWE